MYDSPLLLPAGSPPLTPLPSCEKLPESHWPAKLSHHPPDGGRRGSKDLGN